MTDLYYLVVNVQYLKKSGMTRALRFSRSFVNYIDLLKYIYTLVDPENYMIITICEEDYLRIKKGREECI